MYLFTQHFFPLMFKVLLFSFARRKALESYHILNSYYISLWGEDLLQDTSMEWDSVTPGDGLAHRFSVKFPALTLKLNVAQVCLP